MHLHYPPIHQTPLLEFLFDQDSKDFIALAQEHGIDSLLWNYRSSLKNPEIERSLLKRNIVLKFYRDNSSNNIPLTLDYIIYGEKIKIDIKYFRIYINHTDASYIMA